MEARYGGLEGVQACRLIKGYSLCTEELLPSILKINPGSFVFVCKSFRYLKY